MTATLDLKIDTRQFKAGAAGAEASLKGVSRQAVRTESAVQRMGTRSAAAMRSVGRAAGLMAAAAAVTGVAMIKRTLSTIDAQAKLAQSLQTTVASIQTLDRAAELAGVSTGQLEQGVVALTRRLSMAASGTGPAADAIDRLGLSATELMALPLDQRIDEVNTAITNLIPTAEQAGIASELFGVRAGVAMSRMDSATIRQATQDMIDFGVIVSEDMANQIERTNDALSRIGLVARGLGNKITAALAPALEWIADAIAGIAKGWGLMGQIIAKDAEGLKLTFTAAALHLSSVFNTEISRLLGAFMALTQNIAAGLNKLFNTNRFAGADLAMEVGTMRWAGYRDEKAADFAAASARGAFDESNKARNELADMFTSAIPPASGLGNEIDAIASGLDNASAGAKKTREELDHAEKTAEAMRDQFENIGGNAIDRMIDGATDLKEVVIDLVKELLKFQLKQNLLAQMGTTGSAGASLGENIFKAALTGFNGIKFFDQGGSLPVGQTGVVGEYGPELVTATPSGAQITGRRSTASGGGQSVDVRVAFDDDGGWKAYVEKVGYQAANAGSQMAVGQVKESLPGWMPRLNTDGAIA